MNLEEFIKAFAEEFDETPADIFKADTKYRQLKEWSSLTALSIISMVDDQFDKKLSQVQIFAQRKPSKICLTLYRQSNYYGYCEY